MPKVCTTKEQQWQHCDAGCGTCPRAAGQPGSSQVREMHSEIVTDTSENFERIKPASDGT